MATSGSFNTTGYQDRYLTFSWSIQSQSISDNYTTISWNLVGAGGSSGKWYNTGNFKVVIDGSVVYQSSNTVSLYNGTVVASGTKTIYHNSDGNRTFTASASAGIYAYTSSNASGSDSWALQQIPRQASITSAPNFTDEESPTIYYINPAGDNVSSLEFGMMTSNDETIIPYKSILKTGSSYKITFSGNEISRIHSFSKYSKKITVKFILKTVIANQTYYSIENRQCSIVHSEPVVTGTVYDSNSKSVQLTGNSNTLIRYVSNASASCSYQLRKSATFNGITIAHNGVKKYDTSAVFNQVENGDFSFSVSDSRGNYVTTQVKKTMIPYILLTVGIRTNAVVAGGNRATIRVNTSGNYYNGGFGSQNNTLYNYYRYKEYGGTFSGWINVSNSHSISGNSYNCSFDITGLDYRKVYVVQVASEDKCKRIESEEVLTSAMPVFDWSAFDFNFNVPIKMLGNEMDFPISFGSSGNWTYRKWNSGAAECWGEFSYTDASSDFIRHDEYLPFPFVSRMHAFISSTQNGGWIKNVPPYDNTNETNFVAIVYRNQDARSLVSSMIVYVIGKWK